MLRVAHVLDSLNLGGTETQCVALVRGLAAPIRVTRPHAINA